MFLRRLFSNNSFIEEWRAEWIATQQRQSRHPVDFWKQVAELLIDGRRPMKNNLLTPIGHYANDWPGAMEFLVARNNKGISLEKKGDINGAFFVYEAGVADSFFGTQPYDRLRIAYTKRQWYDDAIRVCRAYLDIPDRPGQNKLRFRQHIEKLNLMRQ